MSLESLRVEERMREARAGVWKFEMERAVGNEAFLIECFVQFDFPQGRRLAEKPSAERRLFSCGRLSARCRTSKIRMEELFNLFTDESQGLMRREGELENSSVGKKDANCAAFEDFPFLQLLQLLLHARPKRRAVSHDLLDPSNIGRGEAGLVA